MASTLQFNYTGGASNSSPAASLGGAHSSVQLAAAAMDNFFADVDVAEAQAGSVKYRAFDITNTGDAASANTSVGLAQAVQGVNGGAYADITFSFGIESSPLNSTTSIANEDTAPTGVTFTAENSLPGLPLPAIPAGGYCRVWVRRNVAAGAANDSNVNLQYGTRYA